MIIQPAQGCRDILVKKIYFPLLGNRHLTHFMSWALHVRSVISDPISVRWCGVRFFLSTIPSDEQLSFFAIFYCQWVELPYLCFIDGQPIVVPGFMQRAYIQLFTVDMSKSLCPDLVKALISGPTKVPQLQSPHVPFSFSSVHLCNFELSLCFLLMEIFLSFTWSYFIQNFHLLGRIGWGEGEVAVWSGLYTCIHYFDWNLI